jgi:hypothetical protein
VKTYQINNEGQDKYVKTDAGKLDVQRAIDFLANAPGEKTIESLLIALRVLGFKATQVKVEAEEVFDL